MIKCDCDERVGIEINSYDLFVQLKKFFEEQVRKEVFLEISVDKPYYIGYSATGKQMEWYADKWYKCNICGTIWEFQYPDFPAQGSVRKFENGIYCPKE